MSRIFCDRCDSLAFLAVIPYLIIFNSSQCDLFIMDLYVLLLEYIETFLRRTYIRCIGNPLDTYNNLFQL